MHYRAFYLLLILVVLIPEGCTRKKQITGKEFIPREVFVDLLVDIHLMDGITNDRKFYRRYEEVDSIDYLGPIFEKHRVTPQMYDTTMYAYSRHPELLDQVYNDVLMKLNIMLDENEQEEEPSIPEE